MLAVAIKNGGKCQTPGCQERPYARDLCRRHYDEQLLARAPVCTVDGCDGKAWSVTTLERFVVSVRARVEARLYQLLTRGITVQQKDQLQRLLLVPEGDRVSLLDQIRSGPTRISGPAIRAAIDRLKAVRALGITVPMKARIPSSRISSLARFANRAKAQAISRMPTARRIATLVAFVHCLEATAQDEVLEVLEMLLHDLFGKAITADQKARLRTLKDLDQSAAALAEACHLLLDPDVPDESLRKKVFAKIPRAALENALEQVSVLIRPPDNVYFQELSEHYRSVRGYLPHVLTHISFEAAPAGRPLLAACDWLRASSRCWSPTLAGGWFTRGLRSLSAR